MGGRGRDAAHMAKARAKRAPFTDARDGRIKSQIRFAFFLSRGKPLTTESAIEVLLLHGTHLRREVSELASHKCLPGCRPGCCPAGARIEPGAPSLVGTTA